MNLATPPKKAQAQYTFTVKYLSCSKPVSNHKKSATPYLPTFTWNEPPTLNTNRAHFSPENPLSSQKRSRWPWESPVQERTLPLCKQRGQNVTQAPLEILQNTQPQSSRLVSSPVTLERPSFLLITYMPVVAGRPNESIAWTEAARLAMGGGGGEGWAMSTVGDN